MNVSAETAKPGDSVICQLTAYSSDGRTLTSGTTSWQINSIANDTVSSTGMVIISQDDKWARNITVTGSYTYNGKTLSDTKTIEVYRTYNPLIIMPESGSLINEEQSVSISCEDKDAKIYYTLDGSEPTMESTLFKRFRISGKTTVKARAYYEDGIWGEVVIAEYALGRCEDPVINAQDEFSGGKTRVEILCGMENAVIQYTLDGSEPDSQASIYHGAFDVIESCVVTAIVRRDEFFDSNIVTKTITKNWAIGDSVGLPDQQFTTQGAAGWVDDSGVMKSGAITDKETSILKSTFVGNGNLSFELKLACEEDNPELMEYDHYELWIDEEIKSKLDGEHDWKSFSYDLEEGVHIVEWRYVKDDVDDAATPDPEGVWLRNIVWSPEKTQTSKVKVELAWLKSYFPMLGTYYFDYEEKANETAANGHKVWECYVAGEDPTDSASKFAAEITVGEDGKPVVTYNPDLGAERAYKILGSTDLKTWTEVPEGREADYNFFKVTVEMK